MDTAADEQPASGEADSNFTAPGEASEAAARGRRNKQNRWTSTQIQEALRLYTETGTPVSEIYRQIGTRTSGGYLESWPRAAEPLARKPNQGLEDDTVGPPTIAQRVNTRRKLSEEQEAEVTRLYAETDTPPPEIAARFGIGESSVYRVAQRHGAALRSRLDVRRPPADSSMLPSIDPDFGSRTANS
jgi:DNA-directed RNA polymerase specialized sigma subunit